MKIVYERANGLVSVTRAGRRMLEVYIALTGLTEADYLDAIKNTEIPKISDQCSPEELPVTFRAIINDEDQPLNIGAEGYFLNEETETVTKALYPDQRRCFRESWRWDGSAIIEDPTVKLEIKKQRVRAVRDKLLELSDKDELRLIGQGGQDLVNIRAYRQSLRDMGASIEADPDNVTFPIKP